MQPFNSIRSVFGHENQFSVLLVPGSRFLDHIVCYHFQFSRIGVPSIVPIETNDVQMLGSSIFINSDVHGGRDGTSGVHLFGEVYDRPEMLELKKCSEDTTIYYLTQNIHQRLVAECAVHLQCSTE
jgi:hypothetical protein